MAEINNYSVLSHLKSEPNMHVIRYLNGRQVASGRGLAFWFVPLGSAVTEIPTDDRELQFMFHGRSRDFQAVTVQGELTYRVRDAERLAERVDFSIDLRHGLHRKQPLDQLATLFTGTARQYAANFLAGHDVRELVTANPDALQQAIETGVADDPVFDDMGLEMVSLRILEVQPTAELEKALQQAGLVLALVGLNLMLCHWLQIITGQTETSNLMFLMAAVTSAVIWPSLFQLLRQIRRSFDVH